MKNRNKGQALVIVLLILGVVLTVGLSVVSQAVNDVRLSEREEEASRAFSAAETGVERALIAPQPTGTQTVGNATYQVTSKTLAGGSEFLFPNDYVSGDTATLYLVGHNADGSLDTACTGTDPCYFGPEVTVCWGSDNTNSGLPTTPALEASVLYLESGTYKLSRQVIDPFVARRASNGFGANSGGGCTVGGKTMEFSHNVNFANLGVAGKTVLMRLKLHYNYSVGTGDIPHPIGAVASSGVFPSQGVVVESIGTFGDATQKVQVTQLHPDAPPIFDYALYAETGGLNK